MNSKIVIDLNTDLPPLRLWLQLLKEQRIQFELMRCKSFNAASRRLGVSRFYLYRALEAENKRTKFRIT